MRYNSEVIYFFTAQIGSESYANLICVGEEKAEKKGNQARITTDSSKSSAETLQKSQVSQPGYAFVRYEINGTRLRVWDVDDTALKVAIKRGKLKGTFVRNRSAVLTETTDNLNKFLRDGGGKQLFPASDEPLVMYERIKLE